MTTFPASHVKENLACIHDVAQRGCDLVRLAVRDVDDLHGLRELCARSPLPLIADVHFHLETALRAADTGIAGLRINPGTLVAPQALDAVLAVCRDRDVALRIGVNAGSLPRDLREAGCAPTPETLVKAAERWTLPMRERGFLNFKVSIKASDAYATVAANRLYSYRHDDPLHLGVTEAGLPEDGSVLSAAAIGALLLDGIGDTIRFSLGDPLAEVDAARRLLTTLGLRDGVRLIVCPGCGRREAEVGRLARRVADGVALVRRRISVAVMGCAVNGPGEAADADIALVGGPGGRFRLYRNGTLAENLTGEDEALAAILDAVDHHQSPFVLSGASDHDA